YEFGTWAGILAPVGLPPAVAEKLSASFIKALQSPMIKTRFAEQAIDVSVKPPQEFAAYMRDDIARWKKLLKLGQVAMLD
ncbi:MAG TPA: tripartite tricarboxylate transporter substrate-binding protein, partial [Burkholderiales bacterium]|nr:tripartite tricarboxylate transporter substrate-binding protein [Burkholderiales bacterium]